MLSARAEAEALADVKVRMVKRMAEVRARLAGAASPEPGKPVVLDAEARALKAELGRLNQQLREFEGRSGKRMMTDTQRAEAAEKAAITIGELVTFVTGNKSLAL